MLALLLAGLFGVVTWQVAAHGPLRDADEALSRAWRQPDPAAPDATASPAEFFADLGHWYVAVPVLLAALVLARPYGRRLARLAAAGAAMAAVPLLVAPLKALLDRPGPTGGTGYYPSGHTATAVVAYGTAALVLASRLRSRPARCGVAAVAALLVLGVGAGLVRRGYHWPLDVVGSCCLGGLLLLALHTAARPGPRPTRPRGAAGAPPGR
ncbi:phosphatase PAP2 family protein [Streptomyces sp. TRM 70351]|uniref:phosphatase PAP2 family protein n=1 Tax=Streptomyces sp. TRM 70351 TaxID=3116552 RepID=UPI002E7AEE7F|nr:phosphatase PAP2 family protein [Streptomyces sp. TRM 70351]MEE1931113.1 phosphatase PAP2 family protein [Streptomyces sp. TRM 70351]